MLSYRIHQTLKQITQNTYPGLTTKPFKLEIHAKEKRSSHGDYNLLTATIRLFNLSRPTDHIVACAIHELAHHLDCCFHGKSGHNKQFYDVYYSLLSTAVQMGVVDYDTVRCVSDASDIATLERHFGKIEAAYDENMDNKVGMFHVKVLNAFPVKESLKGRGYRWNNIELAWCKEIPEGLLKEEKSFLQQLLPQENIQISEANKVQIEAVYYIVVPGAYEFRAVLKGSGYRFNGYGRKGKQWVKKISACDLEQEKSILNDVIPGVKYRVEGRS